jgi:hypothetical protein
MSTASSRGYVCPYETLGRPKLRIDDGRIPEAPCRNSAGCAADHQAYATSGPATERNILSVPKVELHVHLNGSITEGTASELAKRHGADPATALELCGP